MEAAIIIILLLALGTLAEQPLALNTLCHYLDLGKETATNLGNTKKCFAQYLPELESQGATWSQGYSGCQKKASSEQQSVLLKASLAQENIREAVLEITNFIDECLTLTETQEFFNCFAKMAKLQLTNVYNISYNASEQALILNKHMGSIEMEHYICTNRTEDTYIKGTDKIFQSLDQCLQQNESH
nr:uncharacterized protein LOC108073033 [Drosophila kikkawai]